MTTFPESWHDYIQNNIFDVSIDKFVFPVLQSGDIDKITT